MQRDSNTIFLPIKPEYSAKIFSGEKKYEFRKQIPKRKFQHILIYSSSPKKEISGIAIIEGILTGSPLEIWAKTQDEAGMDKESFFQYFFHDANPAHAIKIGKTMLFRDPIELCEFTNFYKVPQSFSYITNEQLKTVVGTDNCNMMVFT